MNTTTSVFGKVIVKEDKLYYQQYDKSLLLVENAWKQSDGFHLVHGWYCYPKPLKLDGDFEIQFLNESTCRIIQIL